MAEGIEARLLEGLWRTVAEHGWRGTTLSRVAEAAGLPLAELRRLAACPFDLLKLHGEAVDRAVLAGTVPDPASPARERLFDVLMRRFDALQPHRAGIVRFLEDLPRDPLTALRLARLLPVSMAWMLEAARVDASGPLGLARVKGLCGVWLAASRTWMNDASEDLSATMAALDRALDRAEQIARSLRLPEGDLLAPRPEPTPPPM
ncbi:MAG: TetR family transcriptional regulator [Acetobacteraceae bacterium]|nr:TetR family transcriptional regulator [Acetobacteraceae bacterium]MCX7685075.1 TetR family transcriptional regulator [Acetobacteraceae bacterium]MDW8399548.1 TetR family transcriptional regulator [Acetobacteraceae bacterium]